MKVLAIFAVCVALISVGVAALDDCGYVPVNRQYFNCINTVFTEGIRRMPDDAPNRMIVDYTCREKEAFFSCMNVFALGCGNKDAIMRETYATMIWCNGTTAADWITDDEAVSMECIRFVGPNRDDIGECGALLSVDDIMKEQTLQAGLSNMRRTKNAMFRCVRRVFRAAFTGADCPGVTWQKLYRMFIFATPFSLMPFGFHIEWYDVADVEWASDVADLEANAVYGGSSRSASEEEEEDPLKRAGMPFFWP